MEREMSSVNKNNTNNIKAGQGQFVKGWSWGNLKLEQSKVIMEANNQPWFHIPYNAITNVLLASKNELGVEFNIDEDHGENEDILCEMRLYLPNKVSPEEDEKVKEGEDSKSEVSDKSDKSQKMKHSAEIIREEISKLANTGALGESIAHVPEVSMITPRGKFDLYMLKNVMKIHGPSHDYRISYTQATKAFLLPKPDGIHIVFVVSLASPIRQGNTTYNYLVFQFKNNTQKTVELNLPANEEERKKILKNDISSPLNGEMYDVIAKLFRGLIGIPIVIPGSFKGHADNPAIRCSLRANEGYLYPLERCLVFIQKPVVVINLENIICVECSRISEANVQQRSFDLTVKARKEEFQFLGLERKELQNLLNYFSTKKVKVKSSDGNNSIELSPSTVANTSRRQRKAPEDAAMELPSSESEFDEDYNSEGMEVEEEGS